MSARQDVVVIGGGLAGITAALRCADAGLNVTLLEARPKLGGLTHSFRRGDLWVDNGQHVFLRCCTAYLELIDRLGVRDKLALQPRLRIALRSPERNAPFALARSGLPAPLHLGGSLLRYPALPVVERLKLFRAALALRRVDVDDPATDQQTFGAWLNAHGQSDRAIDALWDLITVATLNASAHDASLALAATVFQIGLLTTADAADIGWSMVPLQQLHGDAAQRAMARAGVTIGTGAKITGLRRVEDSWRVTERNGTEHEARHVVLAVPPGAVEQLIDPALLHFSAGWSGQLGVAPIVNAHLVLDRKVMDEPFFAGVNSPLQWIFDRTESSGLRHGQYLAVSLSAADETIKLPAAQVGEGILAALRDLLPEAHQAEVVDLFVTREPAATFRSAAGSGRWRHGARTDIPGLVLAGAWTATGWPATMEGAVLSGNSAADVVMGADDRATTYEASRSTAA